MTFPVEIFCCAADEDQSFLAKLATRLTVQQKRGTITLWDKSQIRGGIPVKRQIQRHLARARIFLLLIGPDFLADDYCYNQVMKTALRRHTRGDARVIPVIVRHANWQDVDVLRDIQVLPRGGRPISSQSYEDHALWEVAQEIGAVIEALEEPPSKLAPEFHSVPSEIMAPPTTTGSLGSVMNSFVFSSSTVHFYQAMARLFLLAGLYQQALAAYEEAITLAPEKSELYVGKGNALFHLKQYEEAIQAYEAAIQLNPSSHEPYEGQAKVFEALAQQTYRQGMQQAQQAYEKARKLGRDKPQG